MGQSFINSSTAGFLRVVIIVTALIMTAAHRAQATPQEIGGTVSLSGYVMLDSGSAGTANMLTGWCGYGGGASAGQVMDANGDFLSVFAPGTMTPVSATSMAFTSPPPNSEHYFTPNSLTVSGFTFSLVDSAVLSQTLATLLGDKNGPLSGAVTLSGTGYVSGNGFLATFGSWTFDISDGPGGHYANFSFSTDGGTVPDGGATVALLGIAVGGLALIRRRLRIRR